MRCVYPSFSRLGMQANFIMGGGPHMKIWVSAPGGGMWAAIISSFTNPEPNLHTETQCNSQSYSVIKSDHLLHDLPSGGLSSVNHSLKLLCLLAISSNSSRNKMSLSVYGMKMLISSNDCMIPMKYNWSVSKSIITVRCQLASERTWIYLR